MDSYRFDTLIGATGIYVGVLALMIAIVPLLDKQLPAIIEPIKYLRALTMALAARLLIGIVDQALRVVFLADGRVTVTSLAEGTELFIGLFLAYFLWRIKRPLYEIEQMARHYSI